MENNLIITADIKYVIKLLKEDKPYDYDSN